MSKNVIVIELRQELDSRSPGLCWSDLLPPPGLYYSALGIGGLVSQKNSSVAIPADLKVKPHGKGTNYIRLNQFKTKSSRISCETAHQLIFRCVLRVRRARLGWAVTLKASRNDAGFLKTEIAAPTRSRCTDDHVVHQMELQDSARFENPAR